MTAFGKLISEATRAGYLLTIKYDRQFGFVLSLQDDQVKTRRMLSVQQAEYSRLDEFYVAVDSMMVELKRLKAEGKKPTDWNPPRP